MRLSLGSQSYDLTARALVMGVNGPVDDLVGQGADLLELDDSHPPAPVPVCVVAADDAAVGRALSAGASLLRLPEPTMGALALCAAAGAAVVVPAAAAGQATAAGLTPDRVVLEPLLVDVATSDCPDAATAVGVILGARIVRTADVGGARRICDVLAAVMGSG
jgi:hypothetical protein